MPEFQDRGPFSHSIHRRRLMAYGAGVALTAIAWAAPLGAFAQESAVDLSKWSPEYVRSIAGTVEFDTAGDCGKVVPLDYKGRLTYWYTGPADAEPEIT